VLTYRHMFLYWFPVRLDWSWSLALGDGTIQPAERHLSVHVVGKVE